jgi:hypothetical protein
VAPGCGYESGTRRRVRFLAGRRPLKLGQGGAIARAEEFQAEIARLGRGPNVQEAPTEQSARQPERTHMSIFIIARDSLMIWRRRRSSASALRVYCPCLSAFLLPRGAPEPGAPPCIRHRAFPLTAGANQLHSGLRARFHRRATSPLWGATPNFHHQKPADAGASSWPEPESQNEANARARMST